MKLSVRRKASAVRIEVKWFDSERGSGGQHLKPQCSS